MRGLPIFLAGILMASSTCVFSQITAKDEARNDKDVLALQGKAQELIKSTCYACHNPRAKSHDDIIAPPLAAVKMRYQRKYGNRADFVNGMSAFLLAPSQQSALMRGAVRQFDLMPNPNLEKSEVQLIVEFIYDNQLEEPDWFAAHRKEMHGN